MNEVNSWKSLRHEYRRLKQAAHLAGKAKRGWSWWRFVLRLRAALSADEAIREESWPDENYRQLVLAEEPSQVDVVLAAHDDPEHGPPAREPMIFHCWMVYDPAYDSCSTIASLRSQVYPRWVLHMIDSTGKLPPTIKLYSRLNARMTISSGSPHPIQSRSCWHLFLEPGDRLPRWSLLELARSATRHPEAACLYGDHDEWRPGIGRRANPVLKPGWSPARLLAEPYPGRAIALRDDLVPATWKQSGASAWAAEAALIAHKQKATVIRLQRILLHIRPGQPNGFDDPSWFSAMLDRQPERKPDPEPAVSIVIPGWRSHCWLEQTLHHIMTSMAQVTREILIGGQSFPVGANRVKQSGHIPPVRFIAHSRPASLFTLVDACAGDYVLFLTDHFQSASPDWLSMLMNGIGDDDVVGACPLVLFADHLVCAAGRGFGIDYITGFWNTNQSPEHHDPVRPHDLPGDVSILPEEAALYKRSFLIDHRDLLEGYRNGSAFHAAAGLAAIRHRQRMVFLPAASIVLGLAARDYGRSMCIRDARRLVSDIRASGLKQDPHAHAWIYHENGRSRLRRPEDIRHEDRLRSQMQAIDDVFTSQPRLDVFNRNAMDLFFAESGFDDHCPVADANAASSSDEGAALYVIATLLDPEVHQRYPRALTQSDGGGFWAWLEQQPALNDTAIARLRKLRRQDPAERIKHLYASRTDVRWLHPLAFTSAGERRFAQWLFAFGRDQANIDEGSIWWHLMAGAEDRSSGLKYSYAVHPDWQEDLGRQGTTAPSCREIAAWIQNTFNLSPDVPEEPSTPGHARNAWVNPVLPTRRGVNVLGVFTFPSGLQQATQTCAKALQSIPRPVARRDVMIAGKAPAEARGPFLDVNTHPVTVMVLPPLASRDTWFERAQLTWRQEQYTIGNWYTETANISDEIKRYALDYDEIWAPSGYIEEALRPAIDRPVFHLPPAHVIPQPEPIELQRFGLSNEPFTFLFIFDMYSCMERKNPLGLIQAFQRAFDGTRDAQLIIKAARGEDFPEDANQLRSMADRTPSVHIIDQLLTYRQALGLIKASDAYISMHRAEGLGLTMAEAMLLGVPVAATAYSGNMDFMNSQNSLLIPWSPAEVTRHNLPYPVGSQWAEPNIDAAARTLRQLFNDQDASRRRARQAVDDASLFFSIEHYAQRLENRLCCINETR